MNFTIILLAAIAGFLGLRLYSVLGKRSGHEQQPLPPRIKQNADTTSDVSGNPAASMAGAGDTRSSDDRGDDGNVDLAFEPRAGAGLQAIAMADRSFDPVHFLEGSKSAYRLILEAFWAAETDSLKNLCDDDVFAAFSEGIADRTTKGDVLDNKFISFDSATITDAQIDRGVARIAVRFDAFITAVTRTADGVISSGSLSDAVETHDVWTFSRAIKNDDPNWVLDETDAA